MTMNRNVRLTLIQASLVGLADSVWAGTVIAAFVYIMERNQDTKNTAVGLIEMAYGMATLISAFPVGYLADKRGRAPLIVTGGGLTWIAAVATSYVVWVSAEHDASGREPPSWALPTLAGCMVIWGVSGGIVSGPVQALYADSIPHGERSEWYTYLFAAWLISSAIGPAITVVLFHVYGNGWTLKELRTVMLVGLALEVVGSIPSFFLSDKYALGSENELADDADADHVNDSDDGTTDKLDADTHDTRGETGPPTESTSLLPLPLEAPGQSRRDCITKEHIPYIMFVSGLITALGSGMTVKFFPLFFKNELKFSPAEVQTIYVVTPLAIAAFSGVGTKLASCIGRVETILAVSAVGLGCLLTMALTYDLMLEGTARLGVVAIYVIRTGLMNCTYPLNESILMDAVPKDQRARWKSLESVTQFGWCGSAVIGGALADQKSYGKEQPSLSMVHVSVYVCGCGLLVWVGVGVLSASTTRRISIHSFLFFRRVPSSVHVVCVS
eukprot:m.118401 g.118401  ORF g.118401 m.118401 type:complete len:499 (+) comp10978_c0_seq1:50-1546(+)